MLKSLINYVRCCYLGLRVKKAKGQALVEYAIIIAVVAILIIGALGTFRTQIEGVFTNIASKLP